MYRYRATVPISAKLPSRISFPGSERVLSPCRFEAAARQTTNEVQVIAISEKFPPRTFSQSEQATAMFQRSILPVKFVAREVSRREE